ncbi:melanoregulin [Amia ocellicauda]|uniref:melanoregulin n=1 Tax=Amia ocellicauda TaxID=2972642 RepID=UPI0034646E27|nr:MREG protein [Amia calva]
MGLNNLLYAFCCCRCYASEKGKEKEPLRSSPSSGSEYGSDHASLKDEARDLWSPPQDSPPMESNDDKELHTLLMMRSQVDKDTEEWEKLNYDIHTLRYTRREVMARWKKILLQLGFQKEVDSLLSVNKQSILSESGNLTKARELLLKLTEETSVFPNGCGAQEQYVVVMDRLVSLDSAEEFLKIAKKKYPKK